MFNSRIIKLLALLFFLIFAFPSCGSKYETIYSGSEQAVVKIRSVLDLYNISSSTELAGSQIKVIVGVGDKNKAKKILNTLKKYLLKIDLNSNFDLKTVFIPKREGFKSLEDQFKEIDLVLAVTYLDNIKTFFITIPDHNLAKESVSVLVNELLHPYQGININYNYIKFLEDPNYSLKESKLELSYLEPFSFHVPEKEKSLAGMQLMLILILFLFSGFVLGLWWGRLGK